jgi:ABC-2 type transport system ATP-binding protein
MADNIAIRAENVSKTFKLPHEKSSSIKSSVINFYKRDKSYELQNALDNVSFEVKDGEFFGIVGRNGSGKSTLLKLLAGIYSPSKGGIQVNGRLTPFIELGVGFNAELTGRENVFLNGALLGFNRSEMSSMYDDIVDFAEIEKFMDQKLKNYSSGMQVRLAFSIAIRARSDILLVDEVLAVGDANFQAKCFEYFRTLKQQKRTVVFVSHDRGAVQEFCSRAVLLESGSVVSIGEPKKIFEAYDEINLQRLEDKKEGKHKSRRGSDGGVAKVIECVIMKQGQSTKAFKPKEEITIKVTTRFNQNVEKPVYGIVVNRVGENPIFATNTNMQEIKTNNVKKGQSVTTTYTFSNVLGNGNYKVSPAVASQDTTVMYDWQDEMASFSIVGWQDNYQPVYLDHNIEVSDRNGK